MTDCKYICCRICSGPAWAVFERIILSKHRVLYYYCDSCEFLLTEEPYWLEEAYHSAINLDDVGLVSRNIFASKITQSICRLLVDPKGRFLDFGGGYGLLVRLMRDAGFDFYRFDQFCENIHSKMFEIHDMSDDTFEMITAFEVFEHVSDPVSLLSELLRASDTILISTELLPSKESELRNWWYLGLEHGQHVSFYSLTSLVVLAKKFDLRLFSNRKNLHLLTRRRLNRLATTICLNQRFSWFLRKAFPQESLLMSDHGKALSCRGT